MHILVEYTGQTGVLLMKVHTETVDFKVLERLSFQAFFRHPLCHAISRQCAFSLECGMGVWTHVYIYIDVLQSEQPLHAIASSTQHIQHISVQSQMSPKSKLHFSATPLIGVAACARLAEIQSNMCV